MTTFWHENCTRFFIRSTVFNVVLKQKFVCISKPIIENGKRVEGTSHIFNEMQNNVKTHPHKDGEVSQKL